MVSNPLESRDSIYTVTVYLRIPFQSVFPYLCTVHHHSGYAHPPLCRLSLHFSCIRGSGVGGRYYCSTFELQLTCDIISIPAPSPDHPSSCIIASLPTIPSMPKKVVAAVNCPVPPSADYTSSLPTMMLMLLYPSKSSPSPYPRANAEIQQGNERNYKERSN